jgi:hypothetical protein
MASHSRLVVSAAGCIFSLVLLGALLAAVVVDATVRANKIKSLPCLDLSSPPLAPSTPLHQDPSFTAPPPPPPVFAPPPINAATSSRNRRSRLQATPLHQVLHRRPRLPPPPGFRRRAFSLISGDDNTTIFRSLGACLLEGSVDPLQPMRCTVFRPAVVSTASRRRGRRRLPPCRSCCSYLVSGPSCNLVLFGGPFCKVAT